MEKSDDIAVLMRLKPPLSTEFVEWRRRQPVIPQIADAARQLLRKGLAADDIEQRSKKSA
jgi:hypothetical protein